jgi:eukaryotic-like serine/threonine-protein kinase
MPELTCLRCHKPLEQNAQKCADCGEQVTGFQRTYAPRLIDGKYAIVSRLGVGGMGEIFKVRHIHLNEQRVIKVMRANLASDEPSLQRFLKEARMATMIKHRNLAMLYDFSTLDDGSYYMVWEFIEGTNIQKWISANGPLPPRLAVEVAMQALRGLEALHEMGVIHRDISPENIMLSQDHLGKLLVKVIDLGIAKQLSETPDTGQGLTQTGMFLGKLKYASPEQAGILNEGEALDHRSDLYSFAVVMYEMLTGRAPFIATSPHGYILKHATEKPAPIISVDPLSKVPPKLEAIVMRGLEKNRDDRFQRAGELLNELESIRQTIAPDRYGIGDGLLTLAGRTIADDPSRPATPRATEQSFAVGRTIEDAEVGETAITSVDAAGEASSPQATLLTSGGDKPLPLSRRWIVAAVAGLAVVAISVGSFLALRTRPPEVAAGTPATTSATVIGTSPQASLPQLNDPSSNSTLYLVVSPYGNVVGITDLASGRAVSLEGRETALPGTLTLEPGRYEIVVADSEGTTKPVQLQLAPGETLTERVDFGFSVDEAVEELLRR